MSKRKTKDSTSGKKPLLLILIFCSATFATQKTILTKGPTATLRPLRGLRHRRAGIQTLASDWVEQNDAIVDWSAGASVNPGRPSGRRTF